MPRAVRSSLSDDRRPRTFAWAQVALLVLTFIVFAGTLRFEVLNWDDPEYVSTPLYQEPDALARIWNSFDTPQVYPMVFSSFWLESKVWGTRALGYHLDQVLLHVVGVWLCLRLLLTLGLDPWLALSVTALFALHPVQVASVAWLAERKNLLAGIFSFAALLAFLRWRRSGAAGRYAIVLLASSLALLSKTTAVTLPVTFVLLDWTLGNLERRIGGNATGGRAIPWRRGLAHAGFFLPSIVMSGLTVFREHGPAITSDVALLDRIWIAAAGVMHGARTLLLPVGLSPLYSRWEVAAIRVPGMIAAAAIACLLLLAFRARGRSPWLAFGLAQFVLSLAPTSGIVPFGYMDHSFVADHFLYWPSWSFWLAVISLLAAFVPSRRWLRAAPLVWVVPSLALTPLHARTYHDSGHFWSEVLRGNPRSWGGHNNYGQWLALAGRFDEAEREIQQSITLRPDNPDALFNLGYVCDRRGEWTRAADAYTRTLALDPTRDDARSNLARVRQIQAASAARRQAAGAAGTPAP